MDMAQVTVQTRLLKQKFEEITDQIKTIEDQLDPSNAAGRFAELQK